MLFTKLIVSATVGAALVTSGCANSNGGSHQSSAQAAGEFIADSAKGGTAGSDSLIARADSARIEGSPTARLWIIEVSDFQCPYCRRFHAETYPLIKQEYIETGKAKLAYINFPLPMHQNAWPAALAAMCAAAQEKFWPMHDALFNAQSAWASGDPTPVFDSLATSVGVDTKKFDACLSSKVMRPLVQADKERAEERGVQATPTFLIGGQKIEGAEPIDVFRRVIDAELAKTTTGSR